MESTDKNAIIKQQQLIIGDLITTTNQLRNRVAELQYHIHQHDLLYEHPWQYFFWRIFVWPFHPDNKPDGGVR